MVTKSIQSEISEVLSPKFRLRDVTITGSYEIATIRGLRVPEVAKELRAKGYRVDFDRSHATVRRGS